MRFGDKAQRERRAAEEDRCPALSDRPPAATGTHPTMLARIASPPSRRVRAPLRYPSVSEPLRLGAVGRRQVGAVRLATCSGTTTPLSYALAAARVLVWTPSLEITLDP